MGGVDLKSGRRNDREPKTGSAAEALRSQFVFVLLGLVIEDPGYGYALWQRFESRFGGFLRTNPSAIYPALANLEAAGLIEAMVDNESVGAKGGAKPGPSYRATEQGTRAYRRRVAEHLRGDPGRTEMLGQLVLAGIDGIVAALELLDRYLVPPLNQQDKVHLLQSIFITNGRCLPGLQERLDGHL